MESIIFRYIDKDGNEGLAIGSQKYYKNRMKKARQLIEILGLVHTEEQREEMTQKSQEELGMMLNTFMRNNFLFVERVT